MILDNFLTVAGSISAAGVVTGQSFNTATTAVSTNSIDNGPLTIGGNQPNDPGQGEALEAMVVILTAPTVGTTCKYQVIQADDAALTSNVQIIGSTADIPIASLPIGTLVPIAWPGAAPVPTKRYMGLQVVTVGAIATHSILGTFLKNAQDIKNYLYKSGFAVL